MQFLELDETDYTSLLSGALNQYVRNRSEKILPAPSTPHAKRQSFKNLDKSSCFDLIQRITQSSLLVLEIKVTHDGRRLHSFDAKQREIDSVLRELGIPLDYCYNKRNDYGEVNDDEYTLIYSMTSSPDLIANDDGLISFEDKHITLKSLVDDLLKKGSANAGSVGALFNSGLLQRIRDLNIKLIFFSVVADDVLLFSNNELEELVSSYKQHVRLGGDIDLQNSSRQAIAEELSRNAEELREMVLQHKLRKAQRQELRRNRSRDKGGLSI